MKSTNSKVTLTEIEQRKDGIYYRFRLEFDLHREDVQIVQELLPFVNDLNATSGAPIMDKADFLQACVTYALHNLKSDKDKKPFVLRMDRKPN